MQGEFMTNERSIQNSLVGNEDERAITTRRPRDDRILGGGVQHDELRGPLARRTDGDRLQWVLHDLLGRDGATGDLREDVGEVVMGAPPTLLDRFYVAGDGLATERGDET